MSNNLDLSQIAAAQNQKYQTANDQAGELDAAITDVASFTIDDSNAKTLTNDEFRRYQFLDFSDGAPTPTAACTLTVPAVKRGTFVVNNGLSEDLTVTISGQSEPAPVVAAGSRALLSCDGTDVLRPAGFSDNPLAMGFFFPTTPSASQQIFRQAVVVPFTLPSGLTGSKGTVKSADSATASTEFSVQKNDSQVGTVTFGASATTATFAMASATSFVVGDILSVVAPGTPDGTLTNFAVTFLGTRD